MALGVALGLWVPGFSIGLGALSVGDTNIPMSICLVLMMFPPLAKVRYGRMREALKDKRLLATVMVLNWIVAPALMFGLAALFVPHRPDLFSGMILVGLAPCIAMVLVWIDLAAGDPELATGLVALNSILQLLLFATYAWFYITWLPPRMGLTGVSIPIPFSTVAATVGLYLGVPFALGFAASTWLRHRMGNAAYTTQFLRSVSPLTLIALLATIVLMFSLKAQALTTLPVDVARVAVPLVIFFALMFTTALGLARWLRVPYPMGASAAFTASGNNFELAIAVAIGVFGLQSGQAFVGVIGPLVEVPALLALVWVARWARKKWPGENGVD